MNISKKLNNIMKISQENVILIKNLSVKSSMVHEGCWVNCPTRVGNLEALTVCWREATKPVGPTIVLQRGSGIDRVRRVAVYLFLSQQDKPKRHRSAREILHEAVILYSSVHRKIIHDDLKLTCFKRCRAQLVSEANRISRLTHW